MRAYRGLAWGTWLLSVAKLALVAYKLSTTTISYFVIWSIDFWIQQIPEHPAGQAAIPFRHEVLCLAPFGPLWLTLPMVAPNVLRWLTGDDWRLERPFGSTK